MALQNPKLFGYEIEAALQDVANKPLALRRLNLSTFDLEVIRGSAEAGMIPNDWRSFSRLSVPLIKTMDRYLSETSTYMGLMNKRAGTNSILFGNLNVNGSISGKAIRYNYVKFPETGSTANSEVKIADISTSRVSAWSSSDARATNTDLTIQANASISYGAQVGIATASGELVFGAQGSAKTVGGVTYNDSLGPRLQTTIVPEKKEFDSETPTHKIKVKLGDTFVWLYAMKGIPYTLKGIFRSFDATVNLTAQKPDGNGNPIPASWKVVETGNANKFINFKNKGAVDSSISFRSSSVIERFIKFYYDPDYIKSIEIASSFINEIPEIKLVNAETFNLSNNSIRNLPDFTFVTPSLSNINLNNNPLLESETEAERFLNPIVIAKFPTTITNFILGGTFYGSIRGQTTGNNDGNTSGDGTYTSKDLIVRRFSNLVQINLNAGSRYFYPDDVDTAYLPNIPSTCTNYYVTNNDFRTIGATRGDNGSNTSHFPNGSYNIKNAPALQELYIDGNYNLGDSDFKNGLDSNAIRILAMGSTGLPLPDLSSKPVFGTLSAPHTRNAYSLFTIQDGSGADSDANLKTSMSGYKYAACNELTTINLQYASLKNDRFPVFSNLKLTELFLYDTGIKGGSPSGDETNVIPENTFEQCTDIQKIQIYSGNLLSASIAKYAFIKCAALSSLYYNSNGNTSGNLPDFTANGNLSSLQMQNNNFTGSMPSFSGSPAINYVNLSNNSLSGTISLAANLTNLRNLYLYNNNFTSLATFSGLGNLYRFEAHNNNLGGPIPNFSGSSNLYYLILFNNNFSSYTNGSFSDLRRIKYIDLANNNLPQQAIGAIVDDLYTNLQTYGGGRRVTVNLRGNATPSEETIEIILILRESRWVVTFT